MKSGTQNAVTNEVSRTVESVAGSHAGSDGSGSAARFAEMRAGRRRCQGRNGCGLCGAASGGGCSAWPPGRGHTLHFTYE